MANLNYKAYTSQSWWVDSVGDAAAIEELFQPWVEAINLNASQQGAQVERIYTPSQGSTSNRYKGNLTRFPVGTDDSIYWLWAGTNSGMRVTFSEDWTYSIANSGYGGPDEQKTFVSVLANWRNESSRSYLIGTSTEDNREFFAIGWNTGNPSQYQNAMIIYKDRYGGWAGMLFDSLSATGLFYSATNNTYNTPGGSNLPVATTNVLVPLTIPFSVNPAQDYVQGQFISQPASLDLYALGSISEFGKYVSISTEQYVTSLGYNAFWVRHGVEQSNINVYQTIIVTVEVDPTTNQGVYYFDGVEAPLINITPGLVYAFDQTDPSNLGNPIGIFTEDEPASFQDYPDDRDQLGTGVLIQNNITYLSVATTSTDIDELWYGSLVNRGYAGPQGRDDANIIVNHAATPAPEPTPTPDPTTPTPTPAPTPTPNGYPVEVINVGGSNKYFVGYPDPGITVQTPAITASVGSTIEFDQSDPSNAGHPIAFYTDANKTQQLTTGYTYFGTAGQDGAYAQLNLSSDSSLYADGTRIYYQCVVHAGMGTPGYIDIVSV